MIDRAGKINKDPSCPSCGCSSTIKIGAPGKVFDKTSGMELNAPISYQTVIECPQCRNIRGK